MNKPKWKLIKDRGNYILSVEEGWWVSYNDMTTPNPMLDAVQMVGDLIGLKAKDEETALRTINGNYLVLNGDFRDQYEKACEGGDAYTACLAVYEKNRASAKSDWSNDDEDE